MSYTCQVRSFPRLGVLREKRRVVPNVADNRHAVVCPVWLVGSPALPTPREALGEAPLATWPR